MQAYAFANAPSYLYKKLLETDYVSRLTQEPDESLRTILSAHSPDDPRSVASSYAALVAWLVKYGVSGIANLSAPSSLAWSEAIIEIHRSRYASSTTQTLLVPRVVNDDRQWAADASSTSFASVLGK